MPREGVFAEVITGGHMKVGDIVRVIAPPKDRPFTAAVITLSDKGAAGQREDQSGPKIVQLLETAGYDVKETMLLADDREDLERQLIRLSDQRRRWPCAIAWQTGSPRRSDITLCRSHQGRC